MGSAAVRSEFFKQCLKEMKQQLQFLFMEKGEQLDQLDICVTNATRVVPDYLN